MVPELDLHDIGFADRFCKLRMGGTELQSAPGLPHPLNELRFFRDFETENLVFEPAARPPSLLNQTGKSFADPAPEVRGDVQNVSQ